jgi:hypothetical protein
MFARTSAGSTTNDAINSRDVHEEAAMIFPLILLALGIGAVAAYEFSPKTHQWVDDHVQAFKDVTAAHRVVDAHLDAAAQAAASPAGAPAAQDHAAAATAANQIAVQATTQMAETAQTDVQRLMTTSMAALTHAMQDQINAFSALQVARGLDRASAQRAFDDAVERVRVARLALAALQGQWGQFADAAYTRGHSRAQQGSPRA